MDENGEMECKNRKRLDFDEKGVEKESSFLVQSKYEYISGKDSFGFMEKPEAKSFSVQEMFLNFNEGEGVIVAEEKEKEIDKNSDDKLFYFSFFKDGSVYQEKSEVFNEKETNFEEKGEVNVGSDEESHNSEDLCYEIQLIPENQSVIENSIRGTEAIGNELCSDRHLNGFLNSEQFIEVDREENDDMGFIELETSLHNLSSSVNTDEFDSKNVEVTNGNCEEMNDFQEFPYHNLSQNSLDMDDFASQNVDRVDETNVNYKEMKLMDCFSSRKSCYTDDFTSQNVDVNCEEMKLMDDFQESVHHNSTKTSDDFAPQNDDRVEETDVNYEEVKRLMDDSSRRSLDTDSDTDEDEGDILLEHQNLVRQMKMEMKNSRMTSLPTISEDCESPKLVEDLKPLKINEKIEYKDCIEEIQKFYKSYAEKMRKLDILNYQTLNAISKSQNFSIW